MTWRIILSIILIAGWWAVHTFMVINAPITMNEIASHQFDSNAAWVELRTWSAIIGTAIAYSPAIILGLLFIIWLRPIVNLYLKWCSSWGVVILALICLSGHDAHAYRAKSNYSEIYAAKADETVFLVPLFGDAKAGQAKMNSEEFFRANLVAAKYVDIPHAKLPGSGDLFNDYVNSHQAIVVKRTPFAREYVASSARGTSSRDESFHCETAQSHNVSTGIAIGAMIKEDDSPKYLYYFGPDPKKVLPTSQTGSDATKDESFISAIGARDFNEVMDSFGRRIIQTSLCSEISARDTDVVIREKAQIIANVEAKVKKQLGDMGITVLYVGYAEPLNFDGNIQRAIDDTYVTTKRAISAANMKDALPTLERQARVEFILGLAEAAKNGKLPALPSFVGAIPSEVVEAFKTYMGGPVAK